VKKAAAFLVLLLAVACQHGPDTVVDTVLMDFGLKERPEGYVSAADKVMEQLRGIGETEMRRMNQEGRLGEVKFQESGAGKGGYYKEVKVYEKHRPLDAKVVSGSATDGRGFTGYIEYTYTIYQSPRYPTRIEAQAATANARTDITGSEIYLYRFTSADMWDRNRGDKTN